MNIILAGAGRVGAHLAKLLSAERHSVTVIEANARVAEQVDALDVRTVVGNGASVQILQEEKVGSTDLFVSVTGSDEINLIAAATAKGLGAAQVVARVDMPNYVEGNILYETILGIDYILSPEGLSALEIVKYVESPGMVVAEEFGHGHVQMRQMRVTRAPGHSLALRDMQLPKGVLVGLISRSGTTLIPDGATILEPGDLVTVVGEREQMPVVQKLFHGTEPRAEKVAIMGGGGIGFRMAQLLESRPVSVTLFDWDLARCTELSTKFKKVRVAFRDATSRADLEQEHVEMFDVFAATTDDDERNIMACVLAKEMGARHAVAVVHQPDFASLVGKLGIDHTVTPRASIANRVLRLVHQKSVSTLAILEEGQVEVLEFAVAKNAPAVGHRLATLRFPKRALVASILRGEEVIVPKGSDVIQGGDSVVLISTPNSLDVLQKMFLG